MKQFRPRLTESEYLTIQKMREEETRNVLIVGDLHAPFILDYVMMGNPT
tara:strand:+ start:215 stop:361 length:147 start_codon:yes stop_codon:yes gene_type:complete